MVIARKPLPGAAPPANMDSTHDDPSAARAVTNPEQPHHIQDPDSDVDSWERTDSEDEDEADEQRADESHAHTGGTGYQPAVDGTRDTAAHWANHDHGEGSSALPPAGGQDRAETSAPESSSGSAAPGIATPAQTNPFRRKMSLSQSSGQPSTNVPPMPTEMPPMPPVPLSDDLSKLSLNDTTSNPWQPAFEDQQKSLAPSTLSTAADQEPAQNIWASQVPSRAPSTGPPPPAYPSASFAPQDEKAGWGDDFNEPEKSPIEVPPSFNKPLEGNTLEEDSHAWDDLATKGKGKAPMTAPPVSEPSSGKRRELLNLIDNEPTPEASGSVQPSRSLIDIGEEAPRLPPRSAEKAPAQPAREASITAKTETYQVKNINWYDVSQSKDPRVSPILVQNANGPCPLMALVNALTLSTPVNAEDAVLVNTLKTREQISLDLLLNAVFDELMSERRMTPDVSLPDITALYDFLKGLHTGMNVNPRFIPTEEVQKAFKRTSLTHLHPTERGDLIPGTFEDTREMAFYRTFQIPLIHGWLPSRDDPAYDALKRQAESYEDAQNILFREEELEDKLSSPSGLGLTEEEQGIYQDVLSIKSFLHSSATQLTPWGLEVITKAMRPGSVAILFRNDHFSTLYRHPQTLQIFALVTDAGYAGHQEVVWESLVDVNGERSEFLSGDFRLVGGPSVSEAYATSSSASAPHGQGQWTTVQNNKGKGKTELEGQPLSPKEQEDHDLALALQLQEEEDQRHRNEQAQRRRETQLSEQFIEQQAVRRGSSGMRQGSNGNIGQQPAAPPSSGPAGRRGSSAARGGTNSGSTRGGRPGQQQVRPLVPPVLRSQGVNRPTDAGDDDAPPSYEDAAKDRPYVPPAGHPSHPNSSSSPSIGAPVPPASMPRLPPSRAPGVAGVPQSPVTGGFRRGSSALRPGVPPTAASSVGRDKDCVVM